MNRGKILALASGLAALAGNAVAEGSATIYGVVDLAVESQRATAGSSGPATHSLQMVSGTFSASRLGFKGTEDLGGGLRAFFQLENGFNADDGSLTGTSLFGRKSVVGLGGAWGDLWFGRDYSPAFWAQYLTDVNAFALYGNSGTMSAFAFTGMLRVNNGIYYASPEFDGLRARVTYTLGDESLKAPKDAGRLVGLSGEYRSSGLSATVYRQQRRDVYPANGTTSDDTVYEGVTASYDFGGWSAGVGSTRFDPAGPNTATSGVTKSLWAGLLVKFGSSDVRVNVGRVTTAVALPTAGRSTLVGLDYSYYLSKRTNLYAGIGQARNNVSGQLGLEGASRAIPNNGRGSDTTAMSVGIRETF